MDGLCKWMKSLAGIISEWAFKWMKIVAVGL